MIYARVTHNQKPSHHNILIYQGATFTDTLTIKNTDGTPFDLSNYSGRGKIQKTEFSGSDVDLSVSITDAANGEMKISLSSTQTASLECINNAQTWTVYDVEIYTSDDPAIVYRVLQGQALIEPEITV